jgi:hypothetical protein
MTHDLYKPRVKLAEGMPSRVWVCHRWGLRGYGGTPKGAYEAWLHLVKHGRRRPLPTKGPHVF